LRWSADSSSLGAGQIQTGSHPLRKANALLFCYRSDDGDYGVFKDPTRIEILFSKASIADSECGQPAQMLKGFKHTLPGETVLDEWEFSTVSMVQTEQIKNVRVNSARVGPKVLKQIKVWPSVFVDFDQLAVHDSAGRDARKGFNDVTELAVEGIFRAGIEIYAVGLDGNRPVTVDFDFFCGDERYVALTLIGDLAKRNFAEKHHII
jgi:hypothetical protein